MSFLSFLGITDVYAQAAPAVGSAGGLMSFLPMLIILVLFMYLMVIRPQTKRAKEQRNLINSLKKGDEAVSIGGIMGRIEKIEDDFITLTISQGVNIVVQKNAISGLVPKGTLKNL
jgi:preprotein translocase subunit YajC